MVTGPVTNGALADGALAVAADAGGGVVELTCAVALAAFGLVDPDGACNWTGIRKGIGGGGSVELGIPPGGSGTTSEGMTNCERHWGQTVTRPTALSGVDKTLAQVGHLTCIGVQQFRIPGRCSLAGMDRG